MPAHRAHVRQRQKSEVQGVVAGLLPPSDNEPEVTARSTLLQPRVAVVLGVPPRWHQPLFICRLFSTAPAMWWGLPNAIRFLVQLRLLVGLGTGAGASGVVEDSLAADEEGLHWVRAIARGSAVTPNLLEARLRLSETALAILWVCAGSARRGTGATGTRGGQRVAAVKAAEHSRGADENPVGPEISAAPRRTSRSSSQTVSCPGGRYLENISRTCVCPFG